MNFTGSTCVECGKKIPSGLIQDCENGGICTWRIPEALQNYYAALEASHKELVEALRECTEGGYLNRFPAQKLRIQGFITNAAKLIK